MINATNKDSSSEPPRPDQLISQWVERSKEKTQKKLGLDKAMRKLRPNIGGVPVGPPEKAFFLP